MCNVHIVLQEIQPVALILHIMPVHLSGKVVALHLDNNIEAYLCNQIGIASLFYG